MTRRGVAVAVAAMLALAPVSAATAEPRSTLADTTLTVVGSTVAAGTPGRIGIDLIYEGGGAGVYDIWPCTHNPRLPQLGWGTSGRWEGRTTFSDTHPDWGALTLVRLELYPQECGHYDPWSGDIGGAHVQRSPRDGTTWLEVGRVPLPRPDNGAFRLRGRLTASTPVPDGRVEFDVFQVAYGYPDTVLVPDLPATRRTSGGADALAFATSTNRGAVWSGHWGWPGRYILFVRDLGPDLVRGTDDDVHLHGFTEIRQGRVPTIDLDAVCFGLDSCVVDRGTPGAVSGGLHPLIPTRIIDTREGRGLPGAVSTGDGRSAHPDARVRRLASAQHELVVTGRAGVPRSGVAAVVLNVTAVDAPGDGYVSVVPRPAQTDIFDDQGTFTRRVGTSNLDLATGGVTSRTVIARVGAGGVIRFATTVGPVHLTADLLGWIDTTGNTVTGSGLVPLPRATLLDTTALGAPLAAGTPTRVAAAGVWRVPPDTTAVVLEVSATDATDAGHLVLWAGDRRRPAVSHMNVAPGGPRSNTMVVPVAADGTIDVVAVGTSAHVRIEVVGAFAPGRSPVTVGDPRRVVDTRRAVGIAAGPVRAGTSTGLALPPGVVPPGADAVWVHLTATPTGGSVGVRLWGHGQPVPGTPQLVVRDGHPVSQLLLVTPDDRGRLRLAVSGGDAHVMLDVVGHTG